MRIAFLTFFILAALAVITSCATGLETTPATPSTAATAIFTPSPTVAPSPTFQGRLVLFVEEKGVGILDLADAAQPEFKIISSDDPMSIQLDLVLSPDH